MSRLPSGARWLLRGLPEPEREFVIGDLEEELTRRPLSLASRWWMWRQVFALVWSRRNAPDGGSVMNTAKQWLSRSVRLLGLLRADALLQDLRLALRVLAKDRSYTVTVLLTLFICVGAYTAMFSIVRSVLFRPLPFPDPEQLVVFYNSYPKQGVSRAGSSVPNYYDRQGTLPAVEEVAIYQRDQARIGDDRGAERVPSLRATPSLLRLLRVQPPQGRIFTDHEGEPGNNAVVLIGHALWQRQFEGAPIVGQAIRLNEVQHVVVGVLPPDFSFLSNEIDVVTPLAFDAARRAEAERYNGRYQMLGRLRPGATIEMAQAQVDALNVSLIDRTPQFRQRLVDSGFHTIVSPLHEDFVGGMRSISYLLWAGVTLVLVMGCVNVANLVIVRARGRTREMATRHAIGAGLGQLARQLVVETVVVAITGGLMGLLLGAWALRFVGALGLDRMPRGFEISLDPIGALLVLGPMFVVGLLLALVPILRLRRMDLNTELREESRGGTAGRRGTLGRSVMATAQIAMAFVLLAAAGLLYASFRAAVQVNLGFDPANASTITVELPAPYRNPEARSQYVRRTLEALRGLPEVEAAGVTTLVPFGTMNEASRGAIVTDDRSRTAQPIHAMASSGYFHALGVPFVAGRDFERDEGGAAGDVPVLIDDRLAGILWPDSPAVGRRFYAPKNADEPSQIAADTRFMVVIGVVGEMRVSRPRTGESTGGGAVFYTHDDRPNPTMNFAFRSRTSRELTSQVRAVMARNDPTVPTYFARPMQQWIDLALIDRRAPMIIAVTFAFVAALLAAIGVYGVIAHGVAQRERELGVRMALGGTAAGIFRLVFARGLRIVVVGLALGLAGAYFAGQAMGAFLYGVAPTSPAVLLIVGTVLSSVALLASLLPARRASRIDPIAVLNR